MRVLIIEDNPRMADSLEHGLRDRGYTARSCLSGIDGEEIAATEPFDLIILDVMLPDRDGTDVCRNLRRRGVATPVLMLTALSSTDDTVVGLDAGADDYLGKPFEFDELLARVRALLRRGEATEARHLTCDDLELDLYAHEAVRDGQRITLSNRQFALLHCLMRNENRVLSRAQLAEKVWDTNHEPESNVIDVSISALRRKIDRGFRRPLIHTITGAGYRFGIMDG
jgi:DNA-binding response OmpR family regulator